MKAASFIFAILLSCSTVRGGSHIRSTRVTDGFFEAHPSKEGVFCFEADHGTEHFDISGRAFLTHKGPYAPEIPGLRQLDIRITKGKTEIREKDAAEIRALFHKHDPGTRVFRAADTGLFYVRSAGKTPTRKITIESEQGDLVIIWRNRSE
jgi:hypothetical protein